MPTKVKVCGITRLDDALLAADLGAAALGFNFYKPSPRYVKPAEAKEIIGKLPPFVTAVGVFANETDGAGIARVAREARVSAVQLHGAAPAPGDGSLDGFFLIRALAVRDGFQVRELKQFPADAFLLDAADLSLQGGTGKTFEWKLVKDLPGRRSIILAGGLTPENVGRAIRIVRPYAVDVATGVESSPGIKDGGKLRAFIAAVSRAGKSHR